MSDKPAIRVPAGCVPFKQWVAEEAQRQRRSQDQIRYAVDTGKLRPEVVRLGRLVFVRKSAQPELTITRP